MTGLITLGNVAIPPTPGPDGIWYNELTDWYSLTDDKVPVDERDTSDGAYEVMQSLRVSAAISLHVVMEAADEAELIRTHSRLAAIGAAGPVRMCVEDAAETTERVVSVLATAVRDHHGQITNELDFDMIARDPRRYSTTDPWVPGTPAARSGGLTWPARWSLHWGPQTGSDGRLVLQNRGERSSWPVFRVHGPFRSVSLTNVFEQRMVGLDFETAAGAYVEFDFRTRQALFNGEANVSRYLTSRRWWDAPPRSEMTVKIDVTGEDDQTRFEGRVASAW